MTTFRWLLLALVAINLGGCSGPSSASTDPHEPLIKARHDQIEELKNKAAKRGARPTR